MPGDRSGVIHSLMMFRSVRLLSILLLLAACGASDADEAGGPAHGTTPVGYEESESEPESIEGIRSALEVGFASYFDEYALTSHELECLAPKAVDIVGEERLMDAGAEILREDMDKGPGLFFDEDVATAESLVEALAGCASDIVSRFNDSLTVAEPTLDRACLDRVVVLESWVTIESRAMVVDEPDSAEADAIGAGIAACRD
ncbi:MAG: hypothetical protein OSA99_20650 [Acidimicrobiales bacterium]|nr:hypothetical protein [Acidimicrobiales bacterium]